MRITIEGTANNTGEIITNIISILALIIAAASVIYTWRTNTKKYELSESLRKEILDWYDKCIYTLISLRKLLERNRVNDEKYFELNVTLYSLTESGRFYFPNYNRDKGKGITNSEAYKGNRPLLIDLLVESHKITSQKSEELSNNIAHFVAELKIYQKGFTSELFKLIKPDLYIKKHLKNTTLNILHEKTFSESEYAPQNRRK